MVGKLTVSMTDLGLQALKNIKGPLRAYALSLKAGATSPGAYTLGKPSRYPISRP
jgi:hypothetical protein